MSKKTIEQIKTAAIIVLALIVVFGGSYYASELKNCDPNGTGGTTESIDTNDTAYTSDISESEQADLTSIDIDDYLALKAGSDKAIIYIARPTCSFCQQQEPIMKNIVYEYGITINYLNTDELDNEGLTALVQSDDYFSSGLGTPLTLIVQDDKIVTYKEGLTSKDDLVSLFQEQELIS